MVMAIVALIVERNIIIGKVFSWPLPGTDLPGNRPAGDVRLLQSDALIGESKYC
jgi:hypothetical protein